MGQLKKTKRRRLALFVIPIFIIFLTFSLVRKVLYLSAGPIRDCRYTFSTITSAVTQKMQQLIPFAQRGGTINDMSCLNETPIYGTIEVKQIEDIKNAILFAKEHGLKVSISGIRHSMGGQAFFKDAIVLDMTKLNKVSVDEKSKILSVQSGATWHDIQNFLDPKGLSVKAMQSSDIFTIGGSISANAHGMDHHTGSLGSTLRSITIMLSDGTIQTLSRTQNPQLFELVIGGYGLFGVILDAQIDLTDNVMYEKETTRTIPYQDFPNFFEENVVKNDQYGLFYGHLSTGPISFLKEVIIYEYKKTENSQDQIHPLHEQANVSQKRFFLNLGKTGPIGQQIRYWAEKYIQPRFESCATSRNQALGEPEACFVSRNQDMHESGKFLRNNLKNDTDILQEYFVPRDKFIEFVDGIREILQRNRAVVLNAGIRVVNKEETALNYAPQDSFAIVLYLNQKTKNEDNRKMEKLTQELVDLAIRLGGRHYLTYQTYYTKEQLQRAYPNIGQFFNLKRKYDPSELFMNNFYGKYGILN